MASKPAAKAAPKKAMPARGQRTSTHATGLAGQPYKPSAAEKKEQEKWQAQEDVHHLKRAAEVKADPARHKAAVSHAQAEMKALQSVTKK